MSASSSEVRSATVAMRQVSSRSWSRKSPTKVWVFPASMVRSIVPVALAERSLDVQTDVEHAFFIGYGDHRDEVDSGLGVGAHGVGGDRAGHLGLGPAVDQRHRLLD